MYPTKEQLVFRVAYLQQMQEALYKDYDVLTKRIRDCEKEQSICKSILELLGEKNGKKN
jgi:hypothetical protein